MIDFILAMGLIVVLFYAFIIGFSFVAGQLFRALDIWSYNRTMRQINKERNQ